MGVKFASIDGQDLCIVDSNKFGDGLSLLNSSVGEQQIRCERFISDLISRTEQVNQYLDALDQAYQEYQEYLQQLTDATNNRNAAVSDYNREIRNSHPNTYQLASISNKIKTYDLEIESVNKIIDYYVEEPEPEGSWVLS